MRNFIIIPIIIYSQQRSEHQSFRLTLASKSYYPMVYTSFFFVSFHSRLLYLMYCSVRFKHLTTLSNVLVYDLVLFLVSLIPYLTSYLTSFGYFYLFNMYFIKFLVLTSARITLLLCLSVI